MSNSSIWPIEKTLSGATTLGQRGPGRDSNEGVPCVPQSSGIIEVSPSDCFVSYPEHSLGEFYPSTEMQSVYSATPANRAIIQGLVCLTTNQPTNQLTSLY